MAPSLTYDTGALIAAERNSDRMWALHEQALDAGMLVTVPAGVLAQAWRGGPQARLSHLLAGCEIEPLGESRARAVGGLCAHAGSTDVIDACVVLGAAIRGDAVVTSDAADIEQLRATLGVPVPIVEL